MVCRVLRIKHCICQAMMILFDQPVAINVFCYRFSVASAEAHIKRYFPKCLTTWTTENLPEKNTENLKKQLLASFLESLRAFCQQLTTYISLHS